MFQNEGFQDEIMESTLFDKSCVSERKDSSEHSSANSINLDLKYKISIEYKCVDLNEEHEYNQIK